MLSFGVLSSGVLLSRVLSSVVLSSEVLSSGVLSSGVLSSGVLSSRVLSTRVLFSWVLSSEVTRSPFYLFIENFIHSPTFGNAIYPMYTVQYKLLYCTYIVHEFFKILNFGLQCLQKSFLPFPKVAFFVKNFLEVLFLLPLNGLLLVDVVIVPASYWSTVPADFLKSVTIS
jgi:hypothetical protein